MYMAATSAAYRWVRRALPFWTNGKGLANYRLEGSEHSRGGPGIDHHQPSHTVEVRLADPVDDQARDAAVWPDLRRVACRRRRIRILEDLDGIPGDMVDREP